MIDAEVAIAALIDRLSSDQPVAPQGVAIVERLITDGTVSPVYNKAGAGTLRREVMMTTIALEPESERDEFPLAA